MGYRARPSENTRVLSECFGGPGNLLFQMAFLSPPQGLWPPDWCTKDRQPGTPPLREGPSPLAHLPTAIPPVEPRRVSAWGQGISSPSTVCHCIQDASTTFLVRIITQSRTQSPAQSLLVTDQIPQYPQPAHSCLTVENSITNPFEAQDLVHLHLAQH